MAKLYVPILNKDQADNSNGCLYEITCSKQESVYQNSKFNGFTNASVSFLNEKLGAYFLSNTFAFKIWNENQRGFKNFSERIKSISLGLFCSAYKVMNDKKFNEKYNSITITGDFRVVNGKVQLVEVEDIKDKLELVKQYANYHSDKHHLFLYISPHEIVPEGLHENNLLVVRYDTTFPLECIFAEIFESINDNQPSYYKNKNDYIQTKTFLKMKKNFVKQQDCKGLIIKGKSNTGKSIAANTLCKYLQDCNQIDDYVWLTITDNLKLFKLLRKDLIDNILSFNFLSFQDKESIVKQNYSTEFEKFDEMIKQGKKCLFIIDNIESNYVDQILDFFKIYYAKYTEFLKILITSWVGCNYNESKRFLNVKEIDISEISLDKNEIEGVVNSLVATEDYKYKYQETPLELQKGLLDILYNQYSKFPGFIPNVMALLNIMPVNQIIERFSVIGVKENPLGKPPFPVTFINMDIFSQMVLFACLQLKNKDESIFEEEATAFLIDKIFNKKIFIDKHNIQQGIKTNKQQRFIEDVDGNKIIIKNDVVEYCVFSKEITNELKLLRNTLITDTSKVEYAIENNFYEEFEKYVNRISKKEILNEFFIRICENDSTLPFFELLFKKGVDVNYIDKDGHKPLDVYCDCGNSVEIVKLLIDKGASGLNFFILAVNKSNPEIVEYLLSKRMFNNFEEYYLEKRLTVLQICALFGTNPKVFDLLVNYGAKLDARTKDGWTLLQCAALNQNSLILEHIISKGYVIDLEEPSVQGGTALQLLCMVGTNCKNLQILIDNGANVNVVSPRGQTLLHLAAANEYTEPLEYLLENKLYTDLFAKNAGGQTALELAEELNNSKAVKILKEAMNK